MFMRSLIRRKSILGGSCSLFMDFCIFKHEPHFLVSSNLDSMVMNLIMESWSMTDDTYDGGPSM